MESITTKQVASALRNMRLQIAEVRKASLMLCERQQQALVRMNELVATQQPRETDGQ